MSHLKKNRIYDRCMYKNCENGLRSTNTRLYRFPQASDPRHDVWIQYTGNPRLKVFSRSTLRRMGLCALHFQDRHFRANGNLKRDAIPDSYFEEAEAEREDRERLAGSRRTPTSDAAMESSDTDCRRSTGPGDAECSGGKVGSEPVRSRRAEDGKAGGSREANVSLGKSTARLMDEINRYRRRTRILTMEIALMSKQLRLRRRRVKETNGG